jgi:hypothetical protein
MIEALVGLLLLVGAFVILPLILLKIVFGLFFGLVLLPFKILGGVLRLAFGLVGAVFKVVGGIIGAVAVLFAALLCLVFLPLLPFLLVGGLVWLVARAGRPRPVLRRTI